MPRPGPERLSLSMRGWGLSHVRATRDAVVTASVMLPEIVGGDVVLLWRDGARWRRRILLSGLRSPGQPLDLLWTPDRSAVIVAWAQRGRLMVGCWDIGAARPRWRSAAPLPRYSDDSYHLLAGKATLWTDADSQHVDLLFSPGEDLRELGVGPFAWRTPARGGAWTRVPVDPARVGCVFWEAGPQGTLCQRDQSLLWFAPDGALRVSYELPHAPHHACFSGGSVAAVWSRGQLVERWDPARGVVARWDQDGVDCVGIGDGVLAVGSWEQLRLWELPAWEAEPEPTPAHTLRAMVQDAAPPPAIEAALAPADDAGRERLFSQALDIAREELDGWAYLNEARELSIARGVVFARQGRLLEAWADLAFSAAVSRGAEEAERCLALLVEAQTRPGYRAKGEEAGVRDLATEHAIALLNAMGDDWRLPYTALLAVYRSREFMLSPSFHLMHGLVLCFDYLLRRHRLLGEHVPLALRAEMEERREVAAAQLRHAAELTPQSAIPWLWLGHLYAGQGGGLDEDRARARRWYRACVARWDGPAAFWPELVATWLDHLAEAPDKPFHLVTHDWREEALYWCAQVEETIG